jgi:hypothetical protein
VLALLQLLGLFTLARWQGTLFTWWEDSREPRIRELLRTLPFATCRNYARIAAIALVALGLFGFADVIDWASPASFFHLMLGVLYGWVGFLHPSGEVRALVGGLGVLLVVTKSVVILTPLLWGASPLHGPIEVTCLVVGLLSIVAAKYLRDDTPTNTA